MNMPLGSENIGREAELRTEDGFCLAVIVKSARLRREFEIEYLVEPVKGSVSGGAAEAWVSANRLRVV